ncbi:hypothetical protein JCM10450v2_004036 [Rhodotorula kratochvilovae]
MATPTLPALPVAPGPWTLGGEAWIFILNSPFSKKPIPIPDGNYAPLEKDSSGDLSHRFHGGTGLFLVIRYNNTPVGNYDEIMIVPGLFSFNIKGKEGPQYHWAITRLYVSLDESVANGRPNWGIPKHRADFTFTDLPDGSQQQTVQHPVPGATPFFRCRLQHSRLTPFAFPISTLWLETALAKRALLHGYQINLIQPPIPAASGDDDPRIAGMGQRAEALKGSTGHRMVLHPAKGWGRIGKILPAPPKAGEPGAEEDWSGFGDGKSFPKFKPAFERLNVHLLSFDMWIPPAEMIDVEE